MWEPCELSTYQFKDKMIAKIESTIGKRKDSIYKFSPNHSYDFNLIEHTILFEMNQTDTPPPKKLKIRFYYNKTDKLSALLSCIKNMKSDAMYKFTDMPLKIKNGVKDHRKNVIYDSYFIFYLLLVIGLIILFLQKRSTYVLSISIGIVLFLCLI